MKFKLGKLGKKKDINGICEHEWEDFNAVVIDNHIRMISSCIKCGVCIHRRVYSIKKLKEVENEKRVRNWD